MTSAAPPASPARAPEQGPRRLAAWALAVLAAAAGLSGYAAQCVRRGNDFRAMWSAWRVVLEGRYLYTVATLKDATPAIWRNPPFYTFATAPFGLLELRASGFVWFYVKIGLIVWMLVCLHRLYRRWQGPRPSLLWAPFLVCLPWFNADLTIGHMNLVTSAFTLAGLTAFVEDRELAAALWGSLAVCVKGAAWLLVPFYAARRRFKLAALTAAFCVFWTALPALVWGPSKTFEYNRDFARSVNFQTIFSDYDNGWAENWGLPELAMRVMGQAIPNNRFGSALSLFDVPPPLARALAQGLTFACLLGLLVWWFRAPDDGLRLGFESPSLHHAALAATATLVLSPVTRKAYLGTLLLPYFVLWGFILKRGWARSRPAAVLGALSVAFSLLVHTDLWGRPLAFFFEKWHVVSFSLLSLAAAQVWAARRAGLKAQAAA